MLILQIAAGIFVGSLPAAFLFALAWTELSRTQHSLGILSSELRTWCDNHCKDVIDDDWQDDIDDDDDGYEDPPYTTY